MPSSASHLQSAPLVAVLLLVLATGCALAQISSNNFVSYPFVLGATRCYSCGFGNYSNRSGAEVCLAFFILRL